MRSTGWDNEQRRRQPRPVTTPPHGPSGPLPHWPAQGQPWGPAYPPPPPTAQAPPSYPGYPPPGYGYGPGYPPGYAGYPPGYPPPGHGAHPTWKPGVIPLRPLSLSDIFNGAVSYVRANPKPTLGLTTIVVLVTAVIGLGTGLAAIRVEGDIATVAGVAAGLLVTLLATTMLSGMLTVIVARAVLGTRITAGEAWARVRGRMPALIALTLLEIVAAAAMTALVVGIIYGIGNAGGGLAATLVGIPLVVAFFAAVAYLFAKLVLAPVAIVLEDKGIVAAVQRSFALSRNRFWRILGTVVLAGVVVGVVSAAISVPFDIAGQVLSAGSSSATVAGVSVSTIGQAIGRIITAPFIAGVVTLLYVDARIRSEAFDFTLISAPPSAGDSVWSSR